jgi:hypothetical protein
MDNCSGCNLRTSTCLIYLLACTRTGIDKTHRHCSFGLHPFFMYATRSALVNIFASVITSSVGGAAATIPPLRFFRGVDNFIFWKPVSTGIEWRHALERRSSLQRKDGDDKCCCRIRDVVACAKALHRGACFSGNPGPAFACLVKTGLLC